MFAYFIEVKEKHLLKFVEFKYVLIKYCLQLYMEE